MKTSLGTGINLVLAAGIAMLLAIGVAYHLSVVGQVDQANADAQNLRVLTKLEEIEGSGKASESAMLSYLISRSARDLERLRQAEDNCRFEIARLAELVAGNAEQDRNVSALGNAAKYIVGLQQQTIAQRQQQSLAAAATFMSGEAFRKGTDEMTRLITLIQMQERAILAERRESLAARSRQLEQLIVWGGLMAIALLVFAAMVINIQREQRRRVETRQRQQEKHYRLITDALPAMIGYVDFHHRLRFHNKAYEEWLELSAEKLTNRHLSEILGSEVYAAILPHVEQALRGQRTHYERTQSLKSGKQRHLKASLIPDHDGEGRVVGYFAMILDVTAGKLAEAELQRVNERLDLALQGSRLAIWDADATTGSVYMSEGWAEMLGEAPVETRTDAATLIKIAHPDDREPIRTTLIAALKGASPEYHMEHRVRTRSGQWKWILSHGQVVQRDASGRALRVTGTNADISARKEIERMKNEFVSVVSHELRTPLTSIVGSLGLLATTSSPPEQTQILARIAQDNAHRLVRLVNDILDVEKIESGLLNISIQPVELEALLKNALQANQNYAGQFGANLTLQSEHGPAWVRANADRLMQVMTNLLSNAAKFSPRGAQVEVRLERVGDAYRVSVTDQGPGIPEEFRARIFSKFAQADSSSSRHAGGTGLGLAISKSIVEKLGGKIGYASATGQGTTFYFELEVYLRAPPKLADLRKLERAAR